VDKAKPFDIPKRENLALREYWRPDIASRVTKEAHARF
jgi:hypothetical protein